MILYAGQHAQLAFHGDAVGMGILDNFPGQGHVVLIGQAAAVNHHGGIAAIDAGFDGFQRFAVIQVQGDGNGAVRAELLYDVTDVLCALPLSLRRTVHEVLLSAHKSVGGFRSLENRGGAKQLMNPDGRFDLTKAIHVEGGLAVTIAVSGLQNRAHGDKCHSDVPPVRMICKYLRILIKKLL